MSTASSMSSDTDDNPFTQTDIKQDKILEDLETASELYFDTLKKNINEEVLLFTNTITSPEFKTSQNSTRKFWRTNEIKFPHLFQLALILNNAHCSAATIERFFSICGVVCKKRSLAMSDELIIARSLLKSNIKLLDDTEN
jgi:hypothetical protein